MRDAAPAARPKNSDGSVSSSSTSTGDAVRPGYQVDPGVEQPLVPPGTAASTARLASSAGDGSRG